VPLLISGQSKRTMKTVQTESEQKQDNRKEKDKNQPKQKNPRVILTWLYSKNVCGRQGFCRVLLKKGGKEYGISASGVAKESVNTEEESTKSWVQGRKKKGYGWWVVYNRSYCSSSSDVYTCRVVD
jgi:hypothetical protein